MVLSEAYCVVVELGLLLGVKDIKDLPGAWVQVIDPHWTIAMNGTNNPVDVDLGEGSMGITNLKPVEMAIWFNGWLAGILTPVDGVICAGEAGNEDNFIRDVKRRIETEKLAKQMDPSHVPARN